MKIKAQITKPTNDNEKPPDTNNHYNLTEKYSKNIQKLKFLNLKNKIMKSKYLSLLHYKNNMTFYLFLLIYLLISIGLVIIQMYYYKNENIKVIIARACGILISFNMVFIILLVMRRPNTWLRNTKFGRCCIPFDDFIDIHKAVGLWILILSIVHTVAHSINLYTWSFEYNKNNRIQILNSSLNISSLQRLHFCELLFTTKSKIGWFYGTSMPTGWLLLFIMLVMDLFSIPFCRKQGYFQLFHYVHWLHLPLYIITIFHAKNYWKWFILPATFVLLESILKLIFVKSSNYGSTFIKDVNLLPSNVTHLVITRPKNFKFKAGDYVFINIPDIAWHEWHPFTISSSPELKDEIWLHIRSLGNWTNKLHEFYSSYKIYQNRSYNSETHKPIEIEKTKEQSNVVILNYKKREEKSDYEYENDHKLHMPTEKRPVKLSLIISNQIKDIWSRVYVDGPYRTTSCRIFTVEHAVLIASGIGVTPFASILQTVWFKYSNFLKKCPSCNHEWYDTFQEKKLRKVDFIWVNRDHKSFEWFIDLLAKLESQQIMSHIERFIDFRLFVTGAKSRDEVLECYTSNNNNFDNIEKFQDENFKKLLENVDIGRPNLDKIFSEIASKKKGEVEVYFCGNNDFGKVVNKKCREFKFGFSREFF